MSLALAIAEAYRIDTGKEGKEEILSDGDIRAICGEISHEWYGAHLLREKGIALNSAEEWIIANHLIKTAFGYIDFLRCV